MDGLLLNALLDGIPDRIYFKNLESRFLLINKSQALALGLADPEEAKGKTDFDFFSEEHARQAYADEQKIIQSGEAITGIEEKETWKDGSVTWVSTTKAPFFDKQRNVVGTFGISRDITELHNAREIVEEAERRKVMLESIGAVCHHMSQPITVITSASRMLQDSLRNAPPETQKFAGYISSAADILAEKLQKLNEVNKYRTEKYAGNSRIIQI